MSNFNLGGFDLIVQLAESVINRGLELLPSGSTFPVQDRKNVVLTALGVPIPGIGNPTQNVQLLYDAFLEIERPQITLDQQAGTVSVICDLSPASQLTFLKTVLPADASLLTGVVPQIPLAGSIRLDCPFGTADVSGVWGGQVVAGHAAVARAGGIAGVLTLMVSSADAAGNVPLAISVVGTSAVQVAVDAIRTALASAIGTDIGDDIGDLPLTNPVRLNAGPTPVQTVRELRARISPPGSPPAISLGVLTAIVPPSPGGTIPAPPANLDTLGAVIIVANYWTLHLLCSALTAAHPAMTFTIDQTPRARFQGSVTIEGGDEPIKIKRLDIDVNPNGGLAVDGFATASGGCWDADIDFDFNFNFTCDPNTGAVIPAASPPNVDVDVDKDLLCQIIGAIIGAVGGFIVGAIIGAIVSGNWVGALVGGIIGAVVGGIAGFVTAGFLIDPLDLDGVSLDSLSVLGGLTLPLPVGGAGILASVCDFDDLLVSGPIAYVDLAERHRSGTVKLTSGTGFDLDAGVVRTGLAGVQDDVADLRWTGAALETLPGASLGPVFATDSNAFHTLSLTDLEELSYAGGSVGFFTFASTALPAAKIPGSLGGAGGIPPLISPWVSFALRTDEGRYAKCRARRIQLDNVALEYVVYARPRACLGSVVTLETLAKTVVDSGTETCTEVRAERRASTNLQIGPALLNTEAVAALDLHRKLQGVEGLPDRSVLLPVHPPKRPPDGQCGEHTTIEHHQAAWQLVDRRQMATMQALPSGVVAPLKYRWSVFGTDLPAGTGSTGVGPIVAEYDENSPILRLIADEGEDLIGSVTVYATDADGRQLRATRQLASPSRTRMGGCCPKRPVKLTLRDSLLHLQDAQVAQRIWEAGSTRLRQIAASGRVPELASVSIKEAAAGLGGRRNTSARAKKRAAPERPRRR